LRARTLEESGVLYLHPRNTDDTVVTHADVMSMAQKSGTRLADLLDGVLAKL